MRAALALEAIGDNTVQLLHFAQGVSRAAGLNEFEAFFSDSGLSRPWVARITGTCPRYKLAREFVRGQKDYNTSNSTGSRGIYFCYALEPGLYEVNQLLSWRRERRYFLRVDDAGQKHEISREEVISALCLTAPISNCPSDATC